jgi:two-component system, sensor histidine kinase and response regulator
MQFPSWRSSAVASLSVFVFGLGLSASGGISLERSVDSQAQMEFERGVARVRDEVEQRFKNTTDGLKGAKGLFVSHGQVRRQEFRAYMAALDIEREFPGVRGFGFIQRVPRSDTDRFVAAERADAAPQFAIRQLEDKGQSDLYVIKFIEPATANAGAMGLDVGSESRRRAAVRRAVDTGEATLTGAITLVQDARRTPGALLYLPVYAHGAPIATPEERRAALRGLLYAPIVLAELLGGIHDVVDGRLDFSLFDAADASRLYPAPGDNAAPSGLTAQQPRFDTTKSLALPGRDFRLKVVSTRQFENAFAATTPWLVFGAGTLISALLALVLWQQASRRGRAEALAHGMTADLARLAQVVKHTSNAVTITDRERRIVWVNDGFTRVSGYAAGEALGRTHLELLGDGKVDACIYRSLAESASADAGSRVKLLNRAKDGRMYWFEAEVRTIRDAQGRTSGFMEIGSDMTQRHEAQLQLEAALRDNDALLRTIHMHAIVSVADRAGRITEVNDAFCRISGYPREELLGETHRIVNSGRQTREFWTEMWRTVVAGTPWRGEVCNRAKDGSLYWVNTVIAPFMGADGRIEKYISIRTDITASKDAERGLRRQRVALANIVEGTDAGTWEWNVETGEARINERWARMVGCTLAELSPVSIETWTDRVHPEDRVHSETHLRRYMQGDTRGYECELRLRHKDGHWVWVLGRGKLFSRDEDGRARWMVGTHLDISRRKHAEAALKASQEFLDKAGRIAGVGGWEYVLATREIKWTDETCRIHDREPGHQPTFEEDQGYYPAQARPALQQAWQRCMATGEGVDLELPLVTAKGRAIWVRAVGELECVDGQPVRIVGALQDVTARRAMESQLRHNNEVMHSVLESLPCGVSVFDANHELVVANGEFRKLLDFPQTLFDQPPTRYEDLLRFNAARGEYGTGDAEAVVRELMRHAAAPVRPHRFERVRPDGTVLEVCGAPMPDGGFVTTFTDISARRRAEAEVQRSAQLLRGAIEAIDEAFALYDPDDRLVFCNDKYRSIYAGVADKIVTGARFEDIVRAGAERGQYLQAVGRVEAWVAERVAAHRSGQTSLIQNLDDGRTLRIVERRMADGHIVGFRIDITELVRATEAAQQASQAKSRFLANMSHEIRTPMNAILGMLALLRRTDLAPRQADYAAKTEEAARSLLGLLDDILDFSKVEAGKMELEPRPFRIDQSLRDLSVILSAYVGTKPVEVLFDIDPALPRHLVGDAMRLQQVLINLGGNAIKFTAQGEVVVSMQVLERDAHGVTVQVAVRDTGIGIAPQDQARIFSGFTQAEASTTRRYGGTGLGVAISQRLVALMGGKLELDSVPGQGSRFYFSVKLSLAPEAREATPGVPAPASPLRVLIVDDNPMAREVLQRMGSSLGWSVDLAEGGEAALALLRARAAAGVSYQAVFVDGQMPGLDGWQTSQQIRELGLSSGAAVIVMVTAQGHEQLAQRSQTQPKQHDAFLVKPITASMLYDALVDARIGRSQPHPSQPAAGRGVQRLTGLRLLLVEDNLNNQQVARELLEDEGAVVQIANHGQEAVQTVAGARQAFDVVLMDLQMPVMDGFTATRRIRELGMPSLPILAMTANAMPADREACLAAGMNDHVGKPFDLNHLVALLRRYAGLGEATCGGAAAQAAQVAPATAARAAAAAAAAAGVDLAAALNRLGGKSEVYLRLLRTFIADLSAMPHSLRTHVERGEVVPAKRLLHTLKGLAATLGATALSADAARGEMALGSIAAPDQLTGVLEQAQRAISAAEPGLVALLQALSATQEAQPEPNPPAHEALDVAALLSQLRTLAEHLQEADMAATDAMAQLQRRFGAALKGRLQGLAEAVDALDFERALQLCRQMMEQLTQDQTA